MSVGQEVEAMVLARKALNERRLIKAGIQAWEHRAIGREMLPNEREAFMAGVYHIYTLFLHMEADERMTLLMSMGVEMIDWRIECMAKYPNLICGDRTSPHPGHHDYVPSAKHMGDCAVCGQCADADIHRSV